MKEVSESRSLRPLFLIAHSLHGLVPFLIRYRFLYCVQSLIDGTNGGVLALADSRNLGVRRSGHDLLRMRSIELIVDMVLDRIGRALSSIREVESGADGDSILLAVSERRSTFSLHRLHKVNDLFGRNVER